MTGDPDRPSTTEQETRRTDAERRRRRAAVFGDVLPDGTSDERGDGEGDTPATEEWLRRQVPPHHG